MDTASDGDGRHIAEEIERRRVLFEQTWGQPAAPSIERLLDEVPKTERPDLLRELLYVEFEFTQRKTAELLLEQYLSRFSEYESVVREVADAVASYTVFKRKSIAGYTLLGELGRGGMGVVYRAKSDLLNTFVAFKMVNRRMVGNPETLRRFTRELEMIGRLRHPNIVEAKHAGIAPDGSPFLVMELVEGMTLSRWSKHNPPGEAAQKTKTAQNRSQSRSRSKSTAASATGDGVAVQDKSPSEKPPESTRVVKACAIIHDAALGLQAIHEAGLVHRDIKPGNIMLLPDGRVKILDLGLAKLREHFAERSLAFEPQTRQGHFLGTPGFMAPEQVHSAAHVDIRADIYSLGCTFFFLLFGCAPAENQLKDLPVSLPQKLRKILDRMLAPDPASRFQEPREVAGALEAFLDSRKPRFGRIAMAAVIPVAVGIVAIFLASTSSYRGDSWQPLIAGGRERIETQTIPADDGTDDGAAVNAAGNNIVKTPTLADVQAAVELRYRGDDEQASATLRKLENDLRARQADMPPGDSDAFLADLLAEVLSAQGDCLFFSGLASDALPDKTVKRITDWYEEALDSCRNPVLRTKLLCKSAVVNGAVANGDAGTIPGDGEDVAKEAEKEASLYRRFAEAATATDDRPLRIFAEQFELSTETELMSREALDLRLFALERLIHRDVNADREMLAKDLRLLDGILLDPYPDADSCVYLNRFFDLAVRVCDPTDYGQLVRYLCRLRPQGTVGTRSSFPPDSTLVLLYFSPWSDANGFAVYYPAERQESQRFELPFNRHAVKEAIRKGESLALDARLATLIRRDIGSGTPIVLSWDDTACWPLRRDAFGNEDWPFDESVTVEEILGQMK
ncbi:MAG TPA: hypothetical protein DEB39_05010 [Planctomycetaceae bacterium]|nr:hypothetical protein [Planctomycetaceae bacterium]